MDINTLDNKTRNLLDAIIDITTFFNDIDFYSGNTANDKDFILKLAYKFQEIYQDEDWSEQDYNETIVEFTKAELKEFAVLVSELSIDNMTTDEVIESIQSHELNPDDFTSTIEMRGLLKDLDYNFILGSQVKDLNFTAIDDILEKLYEKAIG